MIGTTTAEYIFIRTCIYFLQAIIPISVAYTITHFVIGYQVSWVPDLLKAWCLVETIFYTAVCLPRQYYLQAAAIPPELSSEHERRDLFVRIMANITDLEHYLSKWFLDSPLAEIKRDNMKEWLRWAFLHTGDPQPEHEAEIDDYVRSIEVALGRDFEQGRGKAKCLRLTVDKVNMIHRSLLWYICLFVVDTLTSVRLSFQGFRYYRTSLSRFFQVFPFRLHNATSPNTSVSKTITYWHRPHTSSTELPLLFIHGIGVGLYPYVPFITEVNKTSNKNNQIGILAIEIMPISSRLTSAALRKEEMCAEIEKILDSHGWHQFVLVSHSYGSVVSAHMLHTPSLRKRIASAVLLDPVCFLLHLPDVAYNFVYRKPRMANEHQLYYFASQDMGISHTLARCFFWTENILWKDDVGDLRITVSLSERDSIISSETVGAYLTGALEDVRTENASQQTGDDWKQRSWIGKGLEVLWFPKLDHAQIFDKKNTRALLIAVMKSYCRKG